MFAPLILPAGCFRNGTERDAAGRWRDVNHVRWVDGAMQPVKGRRVKNPDTPALTGAARTLLPWVTDSSVRFIGIGLHDGLRVMDDEGGLFDITPTGFTTGLVDAVAEGGYGSGAFGEGDFGTPRPDVGTIQPATVWDLDTFGQYMVGCSPEDGRLVIWELDTATAATVLSGAPTGCSGLVVGENGFLFALKGRRIYWCDQGDPTVWTATALNQAGDVDLQTQGALLTGRRVRGATLMFTTVDVFRVRWIGGNNIFATETVGRDCAPVSKGAVAAFDVGAAWMGRDCFYRYDGSVQPLPSEVSDYVFGDINRQQASKVTACHRAAFGEVWWFYPSAGSLENDRAVSWCYRNGAWSTHELARTAAADKGAFDYPLMIGTDGLLYEHEVDGVFDYDVAPYAESGPFEVGDGSRVVLVKKVIPAFSGMLTASFKVRFDPIAEQTTFGPYTLVAETDVLFSARQAALRIEGTGDWRWTDARLEISGGSRR